MRLQLIELIRKCMETKEGDIAPALAFATTHLAPRAPTREKFLTDLEETMALLIFEPTNLSPKLKELLDPKKRKEVANQVNEAILQSQGERTRSRLQELVRTRAWAEQRARAAKKDIPASLDIGLDAEQADGNQSGMGNGSSAAADAPMTGAAASER
jgi:glucose-induced degradation protein 8